MATYRVEFINKKKDENSGDVSEDHLGSVEVDYNPELDSLTLAAKAFRVASNVQQTFANKIKVREL